jgi:hypothetical protein
MELTGTKQELITKLESFPDDCYHMILVSCGNIPNQNYIHTLIRKISKATGEPFDDCKNRIKEEVGLYYFDNDVILPRSFQHLSKYEHEMLLEYLKGEQP